MRSQAIDEVARAVQRQVDLVCLAAMELQHEEPDVSAVGKMNTLLAEISAQAEEAGEGAVPIVEGARLVSQAIALAEFESPAPTGYMGHFVTATAADLARVVHALLSDADPAPILSHARETLRSMPRRSTDFLVEVDLGNQEQVARIFAAVTEEEPELTVVQPVAPRGALPRPEQAARMRELRQLLATYVTHVERLRAQPERRETLDDLLVGAKALRASASAASMVEVNRLLGRLVAVIDAQRARPEPTASEVVAFALACARAIGEATSAPDGSSDMFAALHDASSRLLHQFQVDTRQFNTGILGTGTLDGRRSLYQALGATGEPAEGDSSSRVLDDGAVRARLRQDLAVALDHLPDTLERLERDPRSVAARAALAQLIELVHETASASGLNTLAARCDQLGQSLESPAAGRVPTTLLVEVRRLEGDLGRLLQRAEPHPASAEAPRESVQVDAAGLRDVALLVQELALKRGRGARHARLLDASLQEIALLGERLRALAERPGAQEAVLSGTLAELAEDATLLAADLGRWREQDDAQDAHTERLLARLGRETYALGRAPLSELAPSLERAVRGLASRFGKRVTFVAEVDATAIGGAGAQRLNGALLHLVRNAVDYGIESTAERRAKGKPETGVVRLRAYQEERELVLELSDDGAGIDEAQIVRRAVESGYPLPAEGLSRERALQLVFLPGLTTRPVGSRPAAGHGLNVVGTTVAEMKGTVQIESTLGAGTTVTLRLPQAAATVPAIVVAIDQTLCALPFLQTETLPPDAVRSITAADAGEAPGFIAEVAGARLPAADLGALLGLRSGRPILERGSVLLRLRPESDEWLLRVDRLLGRQELELHALGDSSYPPGTVAHASVETGDRALVLDLAQVLAPDAGRSASLDPGAPVALVADDSPAARHAICTVLERQGWGAVEARDGLEAWELLGSTAPALLLIDLDLALLDATQVIRAAQDQHGIPVIALAAGADSARAHQLQALGVDAILGKPVDQDGLADTLLLLAPVTARR